MNQTIYFRKNVWKHLADEPDKSKLINTLLERHYKPTPYDSIPEVLNYKEKPVPDIPGVSRGFCPHGAGKGLCKIDSCNKKYK